MMNTCKFCLLLLGFVVYATTHSNGESSTCLTVYKEGGAPAVFQSPKCPRWKISNYASGPRTAMCQSAMRQGRRRSQEDRSLCVMDVRILFPGQAGLSEVTVGLMAVFDGHNGAEASELASKLLLEYFMLHAYFLLDTTFSILSKKSVGKLPNDGAQELILQALNWDEKLDQHASDHGRFKISSPKFFGESLCLEILKESLLRAIHDIDATFSKEASRNNLDSGSTATVVLIADGQILVANVGDSKALLCSEEFQSHSEAKANLLRLYRQRRQNGGIRPIRYDDGFTSAASGGLARFTAKVLTRDHHPDRDDERSRVESAGGNVLEWAGVSRVNGQLAVSRAIGDVSFKSYGVISAPEVTDWQLLTANDSYLVASSDGIFEKMTPQEVCDLLWELHIHGNVRSELSESCSHSLADCIVDTALEKGATDNMAAVVVPLTPAGFYEPSLKDGLDRVSEISNSDFGVQKFIDEEPELNHAHPFMAKFDRLLVEGRHNAVGCFYLSENLSESADHTFWVEKVDHQFLYDLPESLPDVLNHYSGGPLNLYNDQNMCLHLGMAVNEDNDKCINPEGFVRFLGLLESIPVHNTGPDYGSPEHDMPDSRYILKKRFGRGAFGEVWLAFQWNCTAGVNASNWNLKGRKFPFDAIHINSYNKDSQTSSSSHEFDYTRDGLFILKRIMVEKGAGVYLSGLREKYFGEVLLNASMFRRGFLCAGISETFSTESPSDSCAFTVTNESVASEMGNTWNFGSLIVPYEEGLDHIARYVESFESRSGDMWLVFRHEGVSLSKLLYTAEEVETSDKSREEHTQRIRVLYPSKWWRWLKTTNAGQEELRSLIRQLLMAIKSCHDRNITHRDIKPENMVICFEDQLSGRCLKGVPSRDENYTTEMRIIDFGSAMDEFTLKHLYGSVGPSRAEQTYEYTPPEALLNASWYQGRTETTLKYDMWSAGVVILELILGSPDVFQIGALARALLDRHLEGWNEGLKELAHKLRAFMELCILIPGSSSRNHHVSGSKDRVAVSPASWKCSEEYFSQQIKSRDPLKIGFPDVWALRLVRQLLAWDPDERLSVDEALRHRFFQPSQK